MATAATAEESRFEQPVTWKGLIGVALTSIGLVGAGVGFAWSVHVEQPHRNAVSQHEFERVIKRLDKLEDLSIEILSRIPRGRSE